MLSIIIPVLNATPKVVVQVEQWLTFDVVGEVIVVDGGSPNLAVDLVQAAGARLVRAPMGRGNQMAAGAKVAVGNWIMFIHLDTRLGPGWQTVTERFMSDPVNRFRAGYFRFALDDRNPSARRVERMVAWRCRVLGIPYGDQGLLISSEFYQRLGGFQLIPLMEDVELVRRISNHRLEALPVEALTSAVRYKREGYIMRPARNLLCLSLYLLGVSPKHLVFLYEGRSP